MKRKTLLIAFFALSLSAGIAEDAAAQQGSRSRTRTTSTTTRKTSTTRHPRPKPASINQGPIVPVETPSTDPRVTMPLLPEPQRNPAKVQIVPAPPPGTVPQPPVPPRPSEMPPQQR